ncbi:MAG: tetratricopeptide repeat protein [Cellvibrionaceae bacterium]|nr:tetratricopeptide repeat protein [Cellvibrionaceae bacterium]
MVFLVLVSLSACSSLSGPVTIRESAPPVSAAQRDGTEQSAGPSVTRAAAAPGPVAPRAAKATLPVIDTLLAEADGRLSRGDYVVAINLAERGLRIDRQDPRFYLVLASAYYQLDNKPQSTAFARQGLRYVQRETTVYQQLKWFSK